MKWLKKLLLLGVVMTNAEAAGPYEETGIHRAITQVSGWFNVSRDIEAKDLAGRIILLDFWTSGCINCLQVMPDLHLLEKEFGEELLVIGVHSAKFSNEGKDESIRKSVIKYDLEHPVVNDKDFLVWRSFSVRAWPTLVLIDPNGKVESRYSGEGHYESIRDDILSIKKRSKRKGIVTGGLPIALEKSRGTGSELSFPTKLAYAEDTKTLFIADSSNNRILAVDLKGRIQYEIGSGKEGSDDGGFRDAEFNHPQGILYQKGVLWIADTKNHMVRMANLTQKTVQRVMGVGKRGFDRTARNVPASRAVLASPWDLEFYPDENYMAIAMAGTHQLWLYDLKRDTVSVLAGNGAESIDDGAYPANSLSQPSGLSRIGGKLYFVDAETSSLRVLERGIVTTLVGTGLFDFGYQDGVGKSALMQHTIGVYADEEAVYMADTYNQCIRKYDPQTRRVSTFAGTDQRGDRDGALNNALFNEPNDIIKIGDAFYVADTNNHKIRVIEGGEVRTLTIREK